VTNVEVVSEGERPVEGILLYPTVEHPVSASYMMKGHKVSIKTINLNQDWKQIHRNLLSLVA